MSEARWKIYKAANSDGYLPAWMAWNESLKRGCLFTGPSAWAKAHRFVRSEIRYEKARAAAMVAVAP